MGAFERTAFEPAAFDVPAPPGTPTGWWAIKDGDNIIRIITQPEAPSEPHEIVPADSAIPAGWREGAALRQVAGSLVWVDTRTLEQAKEQRRALLKLERDAAIFDAFSWNGDQYDATLVAQTRIHGMATAAMLDSNFSADYIKADDSTVTLNAAGALGLFAALQLFLKARFDQYSARRAAVDAATDAAAVDAVNWE